MSLIPNLTAPTTLDRDELIFTKTVKITDCI
jgi:hypothetical protein